MYSIFLQSCVRAVLTNDMKDRFGLGIAIEGRISDSGTGASAENPEYGGAFEGNPGFAAGLIQEFGSFEVLEGKDKVLTEMCLSHFPKGGLRKIS
jgi:hypothetical protein